MGDKLHYLPCRFLRELHTCNTQVHCLLSYLFVLLLIVRDVSHRAEAAVLFQIKTFLLGKRLGLDRPGAVKMERQAGDIRRIAQRWTTEASDGET